MQPKEEDYYRQLLLPGTSNIHFLPWANLVIRNLSDNNSLVTYKMLNDYLKKREPIWILLQLIVFRDNGVFKPIFVCEHCQIMKSVRYLSLDQSVDMLRYNIHKIQGVSKKCI